MSVSALSSTGNNPYAALSNVYKQKRQDFKALESAVQSGDLNGAQQALASFQQDIQNIQSARGASSNNLAGTYSQNPAKNDFASLLSSVQSSDLTGAQSALANLQRDRGAQFGAVANNGQSQFHNDLSSLVSSVQSGDITGAQKSLTALQSDAKPSGIGGHHHHHHHHAGAVNGSDNGAAAPASNSASASPAGNDGDDGSGTGTANLNLSQLAQDANGSLLSLLQNSSGTDLNLSQFAQSTYGSLLSLLQKSSSALNIQG
jgi:hypothetical protein